MNKWVEVFEELGERAPVWTTTTRSHEVWGRLYEPMRKQLSLGISGQVTPKEIIENIKVEYEKVMQDLGQ